MSVEGTAGERGGIQEKDMTYETPTVLYKYMDVSGKLIKRVEDALHNNSLWFSSPREFNDPFDCRCAYDIRDSREEFVTVETA